MFFLKRDITKKTTGMLATEVRIGDAPKPTFSTKSIEKSTKSGNQPLNRQKKKPYFLVCIPDTCYHVFLHQK